MKIIASLLAGALLLAGINMAAAQAAPHKSADTPGGRGKSALVHRMGADGTATQSNARALARPRIALGFCWSRESYIGRMLAHRTLGPFSAIPVPRRRRALLCAVISWCVRAADTAAGASRDARTV